MIYYIALAYFSLTANALAYVDPGTGSFLIQIFISMLLSIGVAMKLWWSRIVSLFSKRKK